MNVFIRRTADTYQWSVTSEQGDIRHHHGDLAALAEFYRTASGIRHWILVAPALDVAARTLHFSDKERRHIRKAIPFLLEDELLTDADDIHFISGKIGKNSVDVVAVDQHSLQQWLDELQQQGIRPTHCIAEYQLLPDSDTEWQLFYLDQHFIVRTGQSPVLAFEAAHLPLSLELLTAHYASLPQSISLFAADADAQQQAKQYLPSALQHLVQEQLHDYAQSWQQQFSRTANVWNLLQGKFVRSREWLQTLKPWRWLAAALALACVLQTVLLFVDYRAEKQRNLALRQQMDTVFRKAFPQGQIVDHRRQMERLLNGLRGSGSNQAFIARLEKIGRVLDKHKVDMLNALNYENDKSEVRLDMLVANYDQLQSVINDLKALNFDVEIQNSNAQGEQLRARVRVSG